MGLFSATNLVVANMIGAGVFTTSGFSLADLGTPSRVIAAWVIGGLVALSGAVGYGALARRIAHSGGEYLFLSRIVHPAVGFLAGWVSLLAGFTGAIALAATAFETYAVPTHQRPDWLPEGAVATTVILFCGLQHGVRLQPGIRFQNLVVVVKLLFLGVFLGWAAAGYAAGTWVGLDRAASAPPFSLSVFAMSLVWISLSYSGFNAAVYVADEVRRPERTVPRALIVGTAIVMALYLALNTVFVYAPLADQVAGRADVAAAAAEQLGGRPLLLLVRVILCLALFTSVSAMVLAGPRVYAKMASDGLFPAWFDTRGPDARRRIPRAAILLQVALATGVALISSLQQLLSYLGFTLSLCAAGTVASLFLIAGRGPTEHRTNKGTLCCAAYYVAATLALATLAAANRPWELAAALATLASGLVAFMVFDRCRR